MTKSPWSGRRCILALCTLAPPAAMYARRRRELNAVPREDTPRFYWRMWKTGAGPPPVGPVHVSMNDYLIKRARDVPRVGVAGMRFRHGWPWTEGALGLWTAGSIDGQRQISVSIWRTPEDLRHFVRSPAHLRVMRDFRHAGDLHTNAWSAERFDRFYIWRQAEDRLNGRLPGVLHH